MRTDTNKIGSEFPRLAIITESTFNSEGTGLTRTLVNLFADYPVDRLVIYAPKEQRRRHSPSEPFASCLHTFNACPAPFSTTRLGQFIGRSVLTSFPVMGADGLRQFSPQLILICSSGLETIIYGKQLASSLECPYVIYSMDDWQGMDTQRWLKWNGHDYLRSVLDQATGWMMIDDLLVQSYIARYKVSPKKVMIVHNPVELRGTSKLNQEFKSSLHSKFSVVYCGSIWGMHLDSIVLVSKAVELNRSRGLEMELLLYCSQDFQRMYKKELQFDGTVWGGFVPYEKLSDALATANLALVAAAFSPDYQYLSMTSMQTKMTDYMEASCPILFCGPANSAGDRFVRRWNIGWCATDPDVEQIAQLLQSIRSDTKMRCERSIRAREVLREHFSTDVVRPKLWEFLRSCSE